MILQQNTTQRIGFEMHFNYAKKNTYFHHIKCSDRNISSFTMERHWPQFVLNKKFQTLSQQNCRHTLIVVLFCYNQFARESHFNHREQRGRWRQKFPRETAEPLESCPVRRKSTFCLVFMFLKKDPVWEITGAESSKSATHTADGISIRFPRVTRIRDDNRPLYSCGLGVLAFE